MILTGNVVVFIRLDGESPVTVFQESNSQINDVRVLAVGTNTDVIEVAQANLHADHPLDGVIVFNDDSARLADELAALAGFVKAGGDFQLYVADITDDDSKNAVLMALMIAGFVETEIDNEVNEYPGLTNATLFKAKKQALVESAAIAVSASAPAKKWTVVADDFDGDDAEDEIIDEDTLLDDTDEVMKAAKDDCDVGRDGKRRACKNCTCGRADENNKPVVSDAELEQMVSGCGNCYKGDAFRCGSCPFLGKPAFKPGMEKVLLNLDDADDI